MYVVHGEVYTFTFETEKIDISSSIPNTFKIHIEAKYNEDFSVFDLGPYVANDVEMFAAIANINDVEYSNVYIHIRQSAGNYISIDIRERPINFHTDPINSGGQICYLKDYVNSYN